MPLRHTAIDSACQPYFTTACIDFTEAKVITWKGITCGIKWRKKSEARKIFWAERRGAEQRGASQREKREMMDWTWEDNEEWNTAQQNVISQTVVWGALLPFHRDCYYRWISSTKTSIPRVQHFLDFAAIEAGFEKPGFESGQSVSSNEAALALRWRLNRKRAHTYIFRSRMLAMNISY